MSEQPVILVYSGHEQQNQQILRDIRQRYPDLDVRVANDEAEARANIPETEILFGWTYPLHTLANAMKLRWFQVMGAGVNDVLSAPDLPLNVTITNMRNIFAVTMAEHALTYMLAHARRVRQIVHDQDAKRWQQFIPERLEGKTVGVAGLGSNGRVTAQRCAALGMRVLGLKRTPGEVPGVERIYTEDQIDRFLPECDYLVFVLPQTRATEGLVTRERFQLMRRDCFFLNMGRGTLYKLDDLIEALRRGWIAGAAIDVFPTEPLPADSPLWGIDNVYITPHIAGPNAPEDVMPVFFENLDRYLKGQPLINLVERERGY